MKTREQLDLENMALAAELSRQLAHDFSNFVYNLLLQIEIWETSPKQLQPDWVHIKQDGKKMASLLQQWDRFQSPEEPTKVDLHEVIRKVASAGSPANIQVDLAPSILAMPLWITCCPLEARHLLRLLLADIVQTWQDAAGTDPAVSIQTEIISTKVIVRILTPELSRACPPAENAAEILDDVQSKSLVAAACRSLALRLDASIQIGRAHV